MTCQHATSGCNAPEGECLGLCQKKIAAGLEAQCAGKVLKEIWSHGGGFELVFGDGTAVTLPGAQVPPVTAAGSALDVQEGGDHYKTMGAYQPWEVLRHWLTPEEFKGYMKGTAVAYLAREMQKGGMLDIRKAAHTLQGLVEIQGAENGS